MWQPIETAPKDRFLLLCGPSGYTTTPLVFTTGRMCSDYHAGRWIDHANDDLSDWGFEPTHWMPMPEEPCAQTQPALSQPAQSTKDDIISDLQSQFDTEGITEYDSGDALIRLSYAIAAVEDNFALAQNVPSVPDSIIADAARYQFLRNGCAYLEPNEGEIYMATDYGAKYYKDLRDLDMDIDEALAATQEAKP